MLRSVRSGPGFGFLHKPLILRRQIAALACFWQIVWLISERSVFVFPSCFYPYNSLLSSPPNLVHSDINQGDDLLLFFCKTLDQRQSVVCIADVIILDLPLALLYNFGLLNGIDFLKSSIIIFLEQFLNKALLLFMYHKGYR